MRERAAWIAVILFVAALIGVYAVVNTFRTSRVLGDTVDLTRTGQALTTVTVFYLNPDSLEVIPDTRAIPVRRSETETIRDLVRFLSEAPDSLESPLPPRTRLLHCFVSDQGEITLDFSADILAPEGKSILEDRLRLSGFLRTLHENLGSLESVRLLVEGKPLEQWGEHLRLDTSIDLETWL